MGNENERSAEQRVKIFDTTLRDGEQSPGIALNRAGKAGDRAAARAARRRHHRGRLPDHARPATSRRCRRSPARSKGP